MDQTPIQQTLTRKEPGFIDHSLLAPTYIRDSNNYIIDFIESTPLVFPNKTVVPVPGNNVSTHTTAATTAVRAGSSYNVKVSDSVSLTPDLHFPSSIFHYRPTPNDVAVSTVDGVAEATLNALNSPTQPAAPLPLVMGGSSSGSSNSAAIFSNRKHAQYMALNGDFLAGGGSKNYCDDTEGVNQAGEDVAVQQFLLADANVSLDDAADLMNDNSDVLYARHVSNARKVLPHKKRISRKLRVSLSGAQNVLSPPLGDVHKLPEEVRLNVAVYSCEICGHTADSQLQFFAHLKQHYEPTTPDTILAAMKTSLEDLEPQKMCAVDKKSPNENVDHVFNDVHLSFPDFSSVDEENPMQHVMDSSDDGNEMKMLNATGMSKCMSYVAQATTPPIKRTVEVEFSDSEDMLEGIRNVVDKVSIEETCDALDLITSNGMRGSWFTNENYGSLTYKNKPFNDVNFAGPLPPMPMMAGSSLSRSTPPKEMSPLPPAEKLLSYQKSDKRREKIQLALPPDDDNDVDEAEVNRTNFYNDALPPLRLPSVDADDRQLHCQSPQEPTTPTNLLEPLRVPQFDLPEDAGTQSSIDNEHLPAVSLQHVEGAIDDRNLLAEKELICKEEPHTQDFDGNEDSYDENDHDMESYAPSPVHSVMEGSNSNERKHICTKCGRDFNSFNALKYHRRTHTGVRPHKCDTCGKSFYALSALKAHTRTHTGDKPFKCDVCQRDFRQWGDLKYHFISKHTEHKNYQCEYCGKAFARKYSLVLHRRIHTCERNFKCDYCDKAFRASNYLQSHRKIHTGEKPYECTVCSKCFRLLGDLRRHERIHQRAAAKEAAKDTDSATNDDSAKDC
ncbi:PREDICTED: uncharacterized protein LOC108375114 isoform X2 [Rhagoletis zephyria]|uniref:uncharacterized protein LOC108375114 isoform X2 n=1 Tax=Rhagoletis zephyria TaxID=28612 RepID=UPI0008112859|nr:PREDICTED: uncharacterized protein LOC108375114 isoform X2 [Rhagoletis zephyria]